MKFKRGILAVFVWLCLSEYSSGEAASTVGADLSEAERRQWVKIAAPGSYCHHVLAVDHAGNALLPTVTCERGRDGFPRYAATTETLAGEDTAGAVFDKGVMKDLYTGRSGDAAARDGAIRNLLHGRKLLYLYLDEMFKAIEQEKPDEVVVHIHGGMNNVNGAIAKTALVSDELEKHPTPGHRVFYIGICWDSDLRFTYLEHLYPVREGLRQPGKALATLPAMLLSDLGSAAARLPLDLIEFLYQDIYTVNPSGFKRTQLAQTRLDQILHRQSGDGPGHGPVSSRAADERSGLKKKADAALWLLTQPGKIPSTYLIDWLGTEPWKNMLRRTRTMFERESEFIPNIDYCTALTVAGLRLGHAAQASDADALLDQMNATGRQGAVELFCQQAQGRLLGAKKRPAITLIGHSMGAIVSCEILERFHRLTLDNVVFMAAACSISDLKAKVIPFLQEQNLRAGLRGGSTNELESKITAILRERGADSETIAAVQRQCRQPQPGPAVTKTRFYNLCLHDTAENGEKVVQVADLAQRGSLLAWIDVLFQKPESENDRTLGRWVNAILATDSLPADVVDRITIKEFGRNRTDWPDAPQQRYAYKPGSQTELQEPMHHGDFGRFAAGSKNETTNLAYWREIYRLSEDQSRFLGPCAGEPAPAPKVTAATRTRRRNTARAAVPHPPAEATPPRPPAVVVPVQQESRAARDARTGF